MIAPCRPVPVEGMMVFSDARCKDRHDVRSRLVAVDLDSRRSGKALPREIKQLRLVQLIRGR